MVLVGATGLLLLSLLESRGVVGAVLRGVCKCSFRQASTSSCKYIRLESERPNTTAGGQRKVSCILIDISKLDSNSGLSIVYLKVFV